jgi:hypothetical protein
MTRAALVILSFRFLTLCNYPLGPPRSGVLILGRHFMAGTASMYIEVVALATIDAADQS